MWKLEKIEHNYPDFTLRIDSLSGEAGETIGFIGPNGAGKTTTIKILMGLIRPDKGTVRIFENKTTFNNPEIYESIGYIGETQGFFYEATVRFNLRKIAPFFKTWDYELEKKLIERFKVPLNKKVSGLSKGNLVKLALVAALSHNPDLLIMDEPTAGLDPLMRSELVQVLKEFQNKDNFHIFFSSHIIEDMEDLATKLVFIHNGEIRTILPGKNYFSIPVKELNETLKATAIWKNDEIAVFEKKAINDLNLPPAKEITLKELSLIVLKTLSFQ